MWGSWQHFLLPEERAVYSFLRHCSFNGARSGLIKLERAAKCNRRRFRDIHATLEGYGLISCYEQGKVIPMLVVVHDVPVQPPMQEAVSMTARVLRAGKADAGDVAKFVAWFSNEWESRHGAAYRILKGKDYGIAGRLLRTHSTDELQRYAIHFMRMFPASHTIGSFSLQINEIAASFKAADKAQM
jgi:hypothetical protein